MDPRRGSKLGPCSRFLQFMQSRRFDIPAPSRLRMAEFGFALIELLGDTN